MSVIVTHTNPDWDAITSVWLLKRYSNLANAEIHFVNTGNPDLALLVLADAIVDTGKEYDPSRLRFDHHQLPGEASNNTCAARQVWEHLRGQDTIHLSILIDLILDGDTGRKEASWSRDLGIHALLSGYKSSYRQAYNSFAPDSDIMAWGFGVLDILDVRLKEQIKIKTELAEKVIYKSKDGLVWAIKYGSAGSSFAAFEEGARLVVFEGEPLEVEGGLTYPIGIMRSGEWNEPHTGNLVKYLLEKPIDQTIKEELSTWFLHPAGFFSGRGTAKAPVFKQVSIDLAQLALLVNLAWEMSS